MIVDASAIVAVMLREPDGDALFECLLSSPSRLTHAVSSYEASLAVARVKQRSPTFSRREVEDFCRHVGMGTIAIGPGEASAALDAFERFGKGRHPAGLNMGDCLSYACAKLRGMPLLYRGDDFARTDIATPG